MFTWLVWCSSGLKLCSIIDVWFSGCLSRRVIYVNCIVWLYVLIRPQSCHFAALSWLTNLYKETKKLSGTCTVTEHLPTTTVTRSHPEDKRKVSEHGEGHQVDDGWGHRSRLYTQTRNVVREGGTAHHWSFHGKTSEYVSWYLSSSVNNKANLIDFVEHAFELVKSVTFWYLLLEEKNVNVMRSSSRKWWCKHNRAKFLQLGI